MSLRRRTHDSSWQWLAIGIVLGLGCSGVLCLGMYLLNVVRFTVPGQADVANAPTVVLVVTATDSPVTATTPATATLPPTQSAAGEATITPKAANPLVKPSDTPFEPDQTLASSTQIPTAATAASGAVSGTVDSTSGGTPVELLITKAPTEQTTQVASNENTSGGNSSGLNTVTDLSTNVSSPAVPNITPTTLVKIQGGIFEMGTTLKEAQQAVDDCTSRDNGRCTLADTEDSFPAHNVTLNAFQIEKYEVSYGQYVAFLNYLGPKSHKTGCGGQPCAATNLDEPATAGSYLKFDGVKYSVASELYRNRPVTFVTWYGADAYCRTLGRRLPTEAEWERAARYTDKRIFPWGFDWDPASPKALTSRPTNQKGPDLIDSYNKGVSAEGVANLAGNVSEWVSDWYDAQYYKSQASSNPIDPQGPVNSPVGHKVVRGGDWDALPFFARAVHRRDFDPITANGVVGFRCAGDESASNTTVQPTSAAPVKPANTNPSPTPVSPPTATVASGTLASGSKNP